MGKEGLLLVWLVIQLPSDVLEETPVKTGIPLNYFWPLGCSSVISDRPWTRAARLVFGLCVFFH